MNRNQMLSVRFLCVVQSSMSKLRITLFAAVALLVVLGLVHITHVRAQSTADNPTQSIADTWQGTLHAGRYVRTVVKISKDDSGGYKAVFYSIDQGRDGLPVTKITLVGTTMKMSLTQSRALTRGS